MWWLRSLKVSDGEAGLCDCDEDGEIGFWMGCERNDGERRRGVDTDLTMAAVIESCRVRV